MNTAVNVGRRKTVRWVGRIVGGLAVGLGPVAASMASTASSQEAPPRSLSLDGAALRGFLAAYEHFNRLRDLPPKFKALENYTVRIDEHKDAYEVVFAPRRAPGEGRADGGETSLGRETHYFIRRRDYRIDKWYYAI
jgi:hypothetical protein